MIQDVLMDWYEEAVLVADGSPNKLQRSEGDDGWLIRHCNRESAPISACCEFKSNKNMMNSGGEKIEKIDLLYCMVWTFISGYKWPARAKRGIKQA